MNFTRALTTVVLTASSLLIPDSARAHHDSGWPHHPLELGGSGLAAVALLLGAGLLLLKKAQQP